MKKCIALFLLLMSGAGYSQPAFIRDSLDACVQRIMADWQIPGMAVCIVKDGKVMVMKGYGMRNLEGKEPVDENTLFMIASNSKAFTGTALAMLENEKRISLDDKLVKYFPWFRMYDSLATREVTIRDAITHRLGLQTFQGDFLHWGGDLSRRKVMEKFAVHQPVFPFRYKYGYCNAGFVAAGEVIPAVTDTSWDDFLKYRIFQPLGMNRTSTTVAAIRSDKNAARGYAVIDDKLTVLDYPNIDNLGAAASVNSSVKDLSAWMLALLDSGRANGHQVIPFSAIQQTRVPQMVVNQTGRGMPTNFSLYGLGWFLEDYNGRKLVRHDGGANGFVTSVCLVPQENLGIAILTNTESNWMYTGLRHQILHAYLDLPYRDFNAMYLSRYREGNMKLKEETDKWKKEADAWSKTKKGRPLTSYEGVYENEVYGQMQLKVVKGEPEVSFSHHSFLKGKLVQLNENEFICYYSDPTYGVVKIPFTVKDNQVISCTVTVNDFIDMMPYEFVRKR